MTTFTATEIKNLSLSPDGKEARIVLMTKYVGEMTIVVPASALEIFRSKTPTAGASNGEQMKPPAKTQGVLRQPKKWVLGSEATKLKIVALIFDPQSEQEAGFALSAQAAKDLAAGLVKTADMLASPQAPTPTKN